MWWCALGSDCRFCGCLVHVIAWKYLVAAMRPWKYSNTSKRESTIKYKQAAPSSGRRRHPILPAAQSGQLPRTLTVRLCGSLRFHRSRTLSAVQTRSFSRQTRPHTFKLIPFDFKVISTRVLLTCLFRIYSLAAWHYASRGSCCQKHAKPDIKFMSLSSYWP